MTCQRSLLLFLSRRLWLATLCVVAVPGLAQVSTVPADPYSYSRSSSFTYFPNGLLQTETVEPGIADLGVFTTYQYDSFGNKTSATTANVIGASAAAKFTTRTSSSAYAKQTVAVGGTSVVIPAGAFATSATNALSQTETRTYDPRFGTVTRLTGPNGLSTEVVYDDFGRAIQETRADGTSTRTRHCIISGRDLSLSSNGPDCGNPTLPLSGDASEIPGQAVTYTQSQAFDAAKLAMGPAGRVYQDSAGRTVREISESFDGSAQPTDRRYIAKDTTYDVYGVTVVVTQPYFFGAKASTTNGENTVGLTRTTVDALGRMVQVDVSDPEGLDQGTDILGRSITVARTKVQHNGLVTTTIDPKGWQRIEEKNADGRVVRFTDPFGGQLVHQHDAFGNLVRTRDALGNVIQVTIDIRGRKVKAVDPDTGAWTYAYDALGQMVEQRSPAQVAAGTRTSMTYDKLGRLTQRVEPEYTSTWYYEKRSDGSLCMDAVTGFTDAGKGKLCETRTSHGVTKRYVYDNKGRPKAARTDVASGPTFGSALTYDDTTGRLETQTYPSGVKVSYAYTARGFLSHLKLFTEVKIGGTTLGKDSALWSAGAVNAWGRPERQELGQDAATVNSRAKFEPATGRATALTAGKGSGTEVLSQAYAWDSLGRLKQRSDDNGDGTSGAVSETFSYDRLNRLTQYEVAAPALPALARTVDLKYNALGNLLYKSDVGDYEYAPSGNASVRPHAVKQIVGSDFGTVRYGYDVNGNASSANGQKWRSIDYTSFNLPDSNTGMGGPSGSPRYTWQYDENHQRIKEVRVTAGGTRTTWSQHPDNQGALSFESEVGSGGTSNRHYLAAGTHTVVIVSSGTLPPLDASLFAPKPLTTVTAVKLEFWHKDQLGSLITTTDHAGKVTARYAYDPYGKRRFTNGQYDAFGTLVVDWAGTSPGGDRGFTGHEHLDDLGVVHMNGRIFDPTIGRFLQGDPMIQAPGELQNYDRYGYCLSGPMGCVDPSGYCFMGCFWQPKHIIRAAYDLSGLRLLGVSYQNFRMIGAIAASALLGPGSGFVLIGEGGLMQAAVAGFVSGAIGSGGTLEGALQGSFSAAVFFEVGEVFKTGALKSLEGATQSVAQVALHGVAGCVTSAAGGGKCGAGALSAAVSEFATGRGLQADGVWGAVSAAAIGGTASVLGGGKFANGAVTAAFGYLFNCLSHPDKCTAADIPEIRKAGAACASMDCVNKVAGYAREAGIPLPPDLGQNLVDFAKTTAGSVLMIVAPEALFAEVSGFTMAIGKLSEDIAGFAALNGFKSFTGPVVDLLYRSGLGPGSNYIAMYYSAALDARFVTNSTSAALPGSMFAKELNWLRSWGKSQPKRVTPP